MAIIREVKACACGAFVPAPFAGRTVGRVIENAPCGEWKASEVKAIGNALTFQLGGTEICLTDKIHSGWQHAGSGGNLNAMFEAQHGDFNLFTDETVISTVCEAEGVTVVRATTPLKDADNGASLHGAKAHTDLYFWHAAPMVTVQTYFEADVYTAVREIYLGRAAAGGKALMTVDGNWRELGEESKCANAANLVCRDIREFDAAHPFTAHIALEACELPELEHEAKAWTGPVIESGDMTIQLERTEGGLALGAILDKKTGVIFDNGVAEPLFKLLLRKLDTGKEEMLTSDAGWDVVREEETCAGPVYRFERGSVALELAAVLDAAKSSVAWEIDVRIRDRNLTAVRLDPPAARMNADDDVKIFVAFGPGHADPVRKRGEKHAISPYPSIGICMEYLAIYSENKNRGIYCGYQDPLACYKMLLADCHDGVCKTEAFIPARGIDEAANGFHMDGQDVWTLFDGDWYDATLIFRDWVHSCASWFTGVPATERKDVPEWLLKMPVWFQSQTRNHEKWMEELFEAQDDMHGIPVGVHAYNWHEIPFDTNYPHYNPARPEFKHKLPVLQAHGLKVMPYINGRLWDTHDRGDYDYQFTSVAKPGATKGRNGDVITEHYESRNSRGEHVELAVMCPSSAIWQEKQMEVNDYILNELGADAVYVDQIAAAPPVTCMDKSHPHRRGGGSWWYEHYYNLIDHLNLISGSEKCYTTESNAEPFTGHIGGMLVWHWSDGRNQVPAYPVVYAGYQPMLGRNYNACRDEAEEFFRIMTAESLCFGDQIGWVNPEQYLASKYRAYFRQLVELRWQYNEFFYAGSCLRPPKVEGDLGELAVTFKVPGVKTAMWKKNADGSRIAIVVNMTDEERKVKVYPEDAEAFEVTLAPASAIIREL